MKQLSLQGLPEFRRFYTKSKLPLFHSRKFSFTEQWWEWNFYADMGQAQPQQILPSLPPMCFNANIKGWPFEENSAVSITPLIHSPFLFPWPQPSTAGFGVEMLGDSQEPISHKSLMSFHKTVPVITRVTPEYGGHHQTPSVFPELIQCLNYVRNMTFNFAGIWISGHKSQTNLGKQDHMELLKDYFQEKQETPTWSLRGSFYFQVGREPFTLSSKNSDRQRLVTRSQISFQLFTYGESNITNRFLLNLHGFCVFCCLFRVDNLLIFFRELLANLSKMRGWRRGQKGDSDFREALMAITLQCTLFPERY